MMGGQEANEMASMIDAIGDDLPEVERKGSQEGAEPASKPASEMTLVEQL